MYGFSINQFKKDIENKNEIETIEYTIANLNNAEDILLNARACKDTDMIEEYIDFLKQFIASK
jgi:hypothetical protein